jgi:hypothetical protein
MLRLVGSAMAQPIDQLTELLASCAVFYYVELHMYIR